MSAVKLLRDKCSRASDDNSENLQMNAAMMASNPLARNSRHMDMMRIRSESSSPKSSIELQPLHPQHSTEEEDQDHDDDATSVNGLTGPSSPAVSVADSRALHQSGSASVVSGGALSSVFSDRTSIASTIIATASNSGNLSTSSFYLSRSSKSTMGGAVALGKETGLVVKKVRFDLSDEDLKAHDEPRSTCFKNSDELYTKPTGMFCVSLSSLMGPAALYPYGHPLANPTPGLPPVPVLMNPTSTPAKPSKATSPSGEKETLLMRLLFRKRAAPTRTTEDQSTPLTHKMPHVIPAENSMRCGARAPTCSYLGPVVRSCSVPVKPRGLLASASSSCISSKSCEDTKGCRTSSFPSDRPVQGPVRPQNILRNSSTVSSLVSKAPETKCEEFSAF